MSYRSGGMVLGLLLSAGAGFQRAEAQEAQEAREASPPASSSWLDRDDTFWNVGEQVPLTEPRQALDAARCKTEIRSAATEEERQVEGAGWMLVGPVQRFGGTVLVTGAEGFDAMCRSWEHQVFAFSDGAFVGTLAPQVMTPQADGALLQAEPIEEDTVVAVFARYAPEDPLCCPSRYSTVTYRIQREGAVPALIPESVTTRPASSE